MADIVRIEGTEHTAKVRSPVWVAVLVIVTLGIYLIFWWYFANRELAVVRQLAVGEVPPEDEVDAERHDDEDGDPDRRAHLCRVLRAFDANDVCHAAYPLSPVARCPEGAAGERG